MDVSAQAIREVEFREKLRGYHQDDVDEFLEKIAVHVDSITARVQEAEARASAAEQRIIDGETSEDTLRRTLVLAQRTADLAVQEAREQAGQIVAEAEEQGRQAMATAEAEVRAEVERLTAERDALHQSVEALTSWLDSHRTQLGQALLGAQQSLQEGMVLNSAPPTPAPVQEAKARTTKAAAATTDDEGEHAAEPVIELTEPEQEPASGEADPFFDELRKAVQDTGPLGTIHDDPAEDEGPLFDQELVEARRSGSRLRRKR